MNNQKKYGNKKDDIISQMFAISYEHGEGFCKGNILKYITRYNNAANMPLFMRLWYKLNGKGTKSDLLKAEDYYSRLILKCDTVIKPTVSAWYALLILKLK